MDNITNDKPQRSSLELQALLMRDYYRDFSKYARGRAPERKVAWVTAFTPVEILEALDIEYIYPESYAAVIAASGKEQDLLSESDRAGLSLDCCSYACCIEGNLSLEKGPRGIPPKPDVLIATNNQCNTLPAWWNLLALRYDAPLIVLDYPGETKDRADTLDYVTAQHEDLISSMEALSGNHMDHNRLSELIDNSKRSVAAWKAASSLLAEKDLPPTLLFDGISFLITSRARPETAELYEAMEDEFRDLPPADPSKAPLFWLGYPLWYHPDRYLSELLDGYRICGSNYIDWWSLDYAGSTWQEQLFSAYNFTFLNLSPETKQKRLTEAIERSGAKAAISLHNKSCKCDFVSARDIEIPQSELEIDMIDRAFLNLDGARLRLETLRDSL